MSALPAVDYLQGRDDLDLVWFDTFEVFSRAVRTNELFALRCQNKAILVYQLMGTHNK